MSEGIVKDIHRKNNDVVKDFLANVGISHLLIFVAIIAVIIYISSKKDLDPKWNMLMYGFLILVILVIYFKKGSSKRLLTREEVYRIADSELQKMVREGNNFSHDDKVYLNGYCHLCGAEDLASGWSGKTHWDVGFFVMVHGSQFKKEGIIQIHPYEGIIMGIEGTPLGYTGSEKITHVRQIPVAVFQGSIGSDDLSKDGNVKR